MKKYLLVLLLLLNTSILLGADEIEPAMQKIVNRFVKSYKEKQPEYEKVTMAVFPFQTDKKLAKKKVNLAVSEILTAKLVQSDKFKLVERIQLETVLKEQALGLSGAVESESAAKVGQILGAKLVVLGNVIQVGKSYQITAKLVDSESSEIISVAISEIRIEVFDEEASRYLVLVPEYQTIGIYLGVSLSPFNTTSDLSPETHYVFTITPTNPSMTLSSQLLGCRYWVRPKWMLDLSGMLIKTESNKLLEVTGVNSDLEPSLTGFGLRITLNKSIKLSRWFNGYLGAGYKYLECTLETDGGNIVGSDTSEYKIESMGSLIRYNSPILRLGLEWKPQARFGWALFSNFNMKKDITMKAEIEKVGVEKKEMDIFKMSYPMIHFETTLSLYF